MPLGDRTWRKWGPLVARVAFGALGLLVLAVLVARAGPQALADALRPAWRFMPFALVLESMRIAAETLATYYTYGSRAHLLPKWMLVRAHIVAYGVGSIMPAGRSASEAAKVAMLGAYVGIPTATAVAVTNQAVTLLAGGLVSLPCAIAAWHLTGFSTVTVLLIGHTVLLVALGLLIRVVSRSHAVGTRLGRYAARFARNVAAFHDASCDVALLPSVPLAFMLVARGLQVAVYGVLAQAVGIDLSLPRVLYAQGINMIALAVGVLVPGQVGASDGAFAMSAEPLGTSMASAMSIALLAHVLQIVWIGVGSLVLLLWRSQVTRRT
jgi:hypothetical protein